VAYKLFYSYQSDIDPKLNSDFIKEALNKAISILKKKDKLEVQLDYGFRKTGGNAPLLQTMLDKIDECDMVLCDFTLTSSRIDPPLTRLFSWRKRVFYSGLKIFTEKHSANPNVLFEAGNSVYAKTYNRTILIMNEAFGPADNLSVDFKGLRHPIKYNYVGLENEREHIIKELTNDLRAAIKDLIAEVAKYLKTKISPILLYQEWRLLGTNIPFQCTEKLKKLIEDLRKSLKNEGNVIRLTGVPGSGKSRVAYEMFKEVGSHFEEDDLFPNLLFYDMLMTNYASIEQAILFLIRSNQRKVIIIDNCPRDVHNKLMNEFAGTKLSCLTISGLYETDLDPAFIITPTDSISIGVAILEKTYKKRVSSSQLEQLQAFAGADLTTVASLINNGYLPEEDDPLKVESFWRRVLGENLVARRGLEILELLSIFSHIGYLGKVKTQVFTVFQEILGLSEEEITFVIETLIKKDIIKVIGDFITVNLRQLELSKSWWHKNGKKDMSSIIRLIEQLDIEKAFINQFKSLLAFEDIKPFINDLLYSSKGLQNFDFLNTTLGSKLILLLVEIFPEEIAKVLHSIIMSADEEKINKIGRRRLNLIWALERLLFRKETFEYAVECLFKLAETEKGDIGNDSSYYLKQVFQFMMAGTEVSLSDRIKILERFSAKPEYTSLMSDIFRRALKLESLYRMIGAETQNGKTFVDYRPKSDEIKEYWSFIIDKLLQTILAHNEQSDKAKETLLTALVAHNHIILGNPGIILDGILKIIENGNEIDMLTRGFLTRAKLNKSGEVSRRIESILKEYEPKDNIQLLKITVSNPVREVAKVDGQFIDRAMEKAIALADKWYEEGDNKWLVTINHLVSGEQKLTHEYVKRLVERIADNEVELTALFNEIVDGLVATNPAQRNPAALQGLIMGLNSDEKKRQLIEIVKGHNELKDYVIGLIASLNLVTDDDLIFAIGIITENDLPIYHFSNYRVTRMSSTAAELLINTLLKMSNEGALRALELVAWVPDKDKEVFYREHFETIKNVLFAVYNFEEGEIDVMSSIQYETIIKSLDDFHLLQPLVPELVEKILRSQELIFLSDSNSGRIFRFLLSTNWSSAWPVVAKFIQEGSAEFYTLQSLFEGFTQWNEKELLEFVYSNKNSVLVFVRILLHGFYGNSLPPLVDLILKEYQNDEDVVRESLNALTSYGWSGDPEELYDQRIELFTNVIKSTESKVTKDVMCKGIDHFKMLKEDNLRRKQNHSLGEFRL